MRVDHLAHRTHQLRCKRPAALTPLGQVTLARTEEMRLEPLFALAKLRSLCLEATCSRRRCLLTVAVAVAVPAD